MSLTNEQIAALLASTTKPKAPAKKPKWQQYADGTFVEEETRNKYPRPEQVGPLRRYDNEMRCASRGCNSPTYYKLQGIQYCSVHVIRIMNDMLVAKGVLS